jgi:hypothetical protein
MNADSSAITSTKFKLYKEDADPEVSIPYQELAEPDAAQHDIDDINTSAFDKLLLTEPVLKRDGQLLKAKITGSKRDGNGNLIGHYTPNPLLNSVVSSFQVN